MAAAAAGEEPDVSNNDYRDDEFQQEDRSRREYRERVGGNPNNRNPNQQRRTSRQQNNARQGSGDISFNPNAGQNRQVGNARPNTQQNRNPQQRRPVQQGNPNNRNGARVNNRNPQQGQYRNPNQQQRRPYPQQGQNQYRQGGRPPQNGNRRGGNGGGKPPKKTFGRKVRDIFPKRGDGVGETIRKLVMIISALVLIGTAIYFAYNGIMAHKNSSTTSSLSQQVKDDESASWAEIKAKYPNVDFPEGMQVKFASLYAQNSDLAGWISIPGLDIDFPVMQGETDDTYLRHNFNKDYTVYGTPFISSYNNIKDLDQNSTIYAHSMRRDDQMFTPLKAYRDADGFKENPIIEFSTLYEDYYFKVYAVFVTNGNASGDNGYLFDYTWNNFTNKDDFTQFVKQINQRKLYSTGVDLNTNDKLLTLSTCTYDFDDARLVVIGRMVRDGESTKVNTKHVKMNPNPRFPQAWYDAKGQTNPYKNAVRWEPSNYNRNA